MDHIFYRDYIANGRSFIYCSLAGISYNVGQVLAMTDVHIISVYSG